MLIKSINGLFFLILITTLTACGGGGTAAPTSSSVNGTIQKGPFTNITSMTAVKLNNDGTPSTETEELTNHVVNNGAYEQFDLPWVGWTRFTATGSYLNEYTGAASTSDITLSSVQNLTGEGDVVNLNLFTTLADQRFQQNVPLATSSNLESSLQTAIDILISSLGLSSSAILSSLDLTQKGSNAEEAADNAILLLFSGAFLKNGADLDALIADFEDNKFDNIESAINSEGGAGALLDRVSTNLEAQIEGADVPGQDELKAGNSNPDWVNFAPVGIADIASTQEETPVTFNIIDNDTDNDPIFIKSITAPNNGTASISSDKKSITYTPNQNFTGSDAFTYVPTDNSADGEAVNATITVSNINDTPVGINDSVSTQEENPISINPLSNDTDADGDTLSITNLSTPSNGTAVLNGNVITYTPSANFTGTDNFTYTPNDNISDGNTVTITINVGGVNDAPAGINDTISTNEDTLTSINVLSNDSDVDGNSLSITNLTPPSNGNATIKGTVIEYIPTANFNGTDTFTYTPNDGSIDGNIVTVLVTVTAVNDAPVAVADTHTVAEDATTSQIDVLTNDTDTENDTLSIAIDSVTTPNNGGTAIINGTNIDYTPAANFTGTETFDYTVNDGTEDGNAVTITVTVTPLNDAPVAVADTHTVAEDATTSQIDVLTNDTDTENDTLSIAIDSVTTPNNGGTAIINGTNIDYTPAANFTGTETFDYTVNDGTEDGNAVTITVTVTPLNDAPVAVADTHTVAEDATTSQIDVLTNDTDTENDTLSIAIDSVTTPNNGGTAIINGTNIDYTPAANFTGTETFDYTVNDGTEDGNAVTITVTVTPLNDAPIISAIGDRTLAISQNQTISVQATDPENDNIALTLASTPDGSSFVSFTDNNDGTGSISIQPVAANVGSYSITITATDSSLSGTTTFNLNVSGSSVEPDTNITQINDTGYLSGVDGATGRDVTDNDNTNGIAGFDFTKIAADGSPATSGNGSCVKDNVTGLIWEVKTTDGGLHNNTDAYTWYDTSTTPSGFNQPSAATLLHPNGSNSTCAGYDVNDPATFCNTQAYIDRVNAAGRCGASDWRLPTREELRSLVVMDDMTSTDGATHIDTDYFPNTVASYKVDCADIIYSSISGTLQSTPHDQLTDAQVVQIQSIVDDLIINHSDFGAYCQTYTAEVYRSRNSTRGRGVGYATAEKGSVTLNSLWTIYFDDKEIDHEITFQELKHVRLVRGNKQLDSSTPTSRYTDNSNGTVTDSLTGLIWKRCLEGYDYSDNTTPDISDDTCTANGTTTMVWSDALNLTDSSFAGSSSWRVPNLKELTSIARYTSKNPAINTEVFPGTLSVFTWSSTKHSSSTKTWVVSFANGGDRLLGGGNLRPVRLVRDPN